MIKSSTDRPFLIANCFPSSLIVIPTSPPLNCQVYLPVRVPAFGQTAPPAVGTGRRCCVRRRIHSGSDWDPISGSHQGCAAPGYAVTDASLSSATRASRSRDPPGRPTCTLVLPLNQVVHDGARVDVSM